MVVISRPFRFAEDDPRPMLAHLDAWARTSLRSAEQWIDVTQRCDAWADYSPRNQILLASYEVVGAAAGASTWERVPSAEAGRGCAVRSGEHGLPIRVPVDDLQQGSRQLRVAGDAPTHRWESVFALEQLARRPGPGTLVPPSVPALDDREWRDAIRAAAGRVLGRMPRTINDPAEHLVSLAGRVTHGANRMRLSDDLATLAGGAVAERVGLAHHAIPSFDPASITSRERWHSLIDVRHAVQVVTTGLSHALGVDLAASPVPRHAAVGEHDVAPGRRNYLAPAAVLDLPIGEWATVGPYSKREWLTRGVAGASGLAEFLRVNDRSYLAVYEARDGAMWRLETTGRGAHWGLVDEGTAEDVGAAKAAAQSRLAERFPDIAESAGLAGSAARHPSAARVLPFDRAGPSLPGADVDQRVAELAAGSWSRDALVELIGHRLIERDRRDLAATDSPARLVATMAAAGVVQPMTMLAVLHAEHVDVDRVTELVPTLGIPIGAAIRSIHDLWGTDRLDIAAELGATVAELREAGCSPAEMLAAAPRETLRSLDTKEETWEAVGPTLLEAGYTVAEAIAHLAAHAPTAETFAVAVSVIEDEPVAAFAYASRRAQPEDLAALAERYGLSPDQTATALASALLPMDVALEVIGLRCDSDSTAPRTVATTSLADDQEIDPRKEPVDEALEWPEVTVENALSL